MAPSVVSVVVNREDTARREPRPPSSNRHPHEKHPTATLTLPDDGHTQERNPQSAIAPVTSVPLQ